MKKTLLILSLMIVVIGSLSGCGGQTSTGNTKPEDRSEIVGEQVEGALVSSQQTTAESRTDWTQDSDKHIETELLAEIGTQPDILAAIQSSNMLSGRNFFAGDDGEIHFYLSSSLCI